MTETKTKKIRVTFRCGHPPMELERDFKETPVCPVCQERVVKSVVGATPRFTGSCQGPLVSGGPR